MKASKAARAAQATTPPVVVKQSESSRFAPIYPLSIPRRLLIAFLIGLPTTIMFPFNDMANPFFWGQPDIPILVLLIALLIGVVRDPVVREGRIEQKRVTSSMITVVLMLVAYFLAEVALLVVGNLATLVAFALIPVTVGLVAGFVLSGGKTKGIGLACGACAWAGAAIGNVLAITYNVIIVYSTPDFAKKYPNIKSLGAAIGIQLAVALMLHFTGLAIGTWGGEWGWRLRKKLLGPDSVLESNRLFEPKAKE